MRWLFSELTSLLFEEPPSYDGNALRTLFSRSLLGRGIRSLVDLSSAESAIATEAISLLNGLLRSDFGNVLSGLPSQSLRSLAARILEAGLDLPQPIAPIDFRNASKSQNATTMGYDLIDLASQYSRYEAIFGEAASDYFRSTNPLLQVEDGRVIVEVAAAGDMDALMAELETHGFVATGQFGAVVSGYIPMDSMMAMADSEAMQFMRPAYRPVINQGIATNQGDIALRADAVRSTLGITGNGITVGVLSDSFNNLGGAFFNRLQGDLPLVYVLQDLPGGGSDEGRAMLQLIFDIAPGADLAFQTAFLGQANFAQGIVNLATIAGADVLVDDIIYFAEPFFQDGIIAQAVDQVVANGAAYFSSAGNNNNLAYQQTFRNSRAVINFGNFQVEAHDFDPGPGVDIFQTITVGGGADISLSFQWDSPYFSASGVNGATNDLDIFLLNSANQVVAASFDGNLNGDPIEVLNFSNPNAFDTQYRVLIGKFAGQDPGLIKYVGFGDFTIDEYDTQSGTLFGKANAEGAQAVGAAFFGESPAFGDFSPAVEPFSSVGGTPILFDLQGNRLATPDNRLKPEIVAPDGGNTTFFGQDIAADADTFPNFFGTSASAPNAAAVAALLLDAVPGATPAAIYQALQASAIDLDDPNTPGFDVGFDAASGFGLIQADAALQALVSSPAIAALESPATSLAAPTAGTSLDGEPIAGSEVILGTDAEDDLLLGGLNSGLLNGELASGVNDFALAVEEGTDTITDFELGANVTGVSGLTTVDLTLADNAVISGGGTLAELQTAADALAVDYAV